MKFPTLFKRKNVVPAPVQKKGMVEFFSPDGMRTVVRLLGGISSDVDEVTRQTAFGAAVYSYAAMLWRADKYSEPPLYVAEVDAEDNETWLPNHPLARLLDVPSIDLDMGELLYITRLYRDATGACIWVKDNNLVGDLGRLTPFSGDEFRVNPANGRMFGKFTIRTAQGIREYPAERVVFFREIGLDPWGVGQAPLDVALSSLNLGVRAIATVKDILKNALFPSVIVQADEEWHPTDDEFEKWKAQLNNYASRENKGKPLALLGGGDATVVGMTLKDLVPDAILDRVEANVSAAFRVPAIVLQFLVGMKNSPWSQMAEARRMAYEDTLQPMWRRDEKKLTMQLLQAPTDEGRQVIDPAPNHFIKYDLSEISALQQDRTVQADISQKIAQIAKRNERRVIVGLDPLPDDDPRGDEIVSGGPTLGDPNNPTPPPPAPKPPAKAATKGTPMRGWLWTEFDIETKAQEPFWSREVERVLSSQKKRVQEIARRTLKANSDGSLNADSVKTFLAQADRYLSDEGRTLLRNQVEPLIDSTAEQAVKRMGVRLGVDFSLLEPSLPGYVTREAAALVTSVTQTTKDDLARILRGAVEEGQSVEKAAKTMSEAHAFSRARSRLIARTETTRVTNGSRRESLEQYAKDNDVRITKTWLNSGDDRVRDAHLDQSEGGVGGETVNIDDEFSNGLTEPCEPNCRCTLTFTVED